MEIAITGVVSLIIAIVFAYFCHRIAVSKGRGPVLWTILGFLFPIIAIIVIAILPPKHARAS